MRTKPMELLAPAGDPPCLDAAIEGGADAVYLGLSLLNARRGAKNFTPAELEKAVDTAHREDVKVHLTLNIDISRRETGAAARILSLARDVGVDAVIVRDPAVVALWRSMRDAFGDDVPALHLSTQSAVTNPEGARLARDAGAARVVLAREMSLAEIRELASLDGLEIEVFAQGALCYSISGRCLLSSWGGGRSGNRGLCASPCRVPWAVDGEAVGTAMSMRDLVTVDRLAELDAAGVDALKIEGRLKKPEWVREAVKLYREALGPRKIVSPIAPGADDAALERARRLAAYAGRETTSSYLDGNYTGLTGVSARKSAAAASHAIDEFLSSTPPARAAAEADGYELDVTVTDKGISCRCRCRDRSHSFRLPKTRIKREKKAVSLEDLFGQLKASPFGQSRLIGAYSNEPDFMLPPRNVKAIVSAIGGFVGRVTGGDDDGSDAVMKAPLPNAMRAALAAPPPDPANVRRLGERPSQVRIALKQLNSSLLPILRDVELVVQGVGPRDIEFMAKFVEPPEVRLSFPEVYFPGQSREMAELAGLCARLGIRAEANCWGSLWLCREHGLDFTVGPGLPVLNHMAVKLFRQLGARGVTMSVEADKRQIEDVSAASALPLTLIVFGRPALAYTRIPKAELLPHGGAAHDGAWTDRRGISLHPDSESSLTVFRSLTAFDWKGLHNPDIKVANLAVDLSGESYPVNAWKQFVAPGAKPGFLFNYDRGLQ